MQRCSSVSPRGAQHHLGSVDGLRALAALYVVFSHTVLVAMPVHGGHRAGGGRPAWLVPGHFAVAVFIVLSGFCLTLPVVHSGGELPGGVCAFYRRRARRILPPYYAALVITLALCWTALSARTGTFWDWSVPITTAGYVGNLLLVQDVVGFWQVSVPFWSIAVECQIYLLFPVLLRCWRRFGAARTVLAAVWLSYPAVSITDALGRRGPAYFPGLTLQFVGFFALGMAAAWLAFSNGAEWVRARERLPWRALAVAAAVVALVPTLLVGGLADWLAPLLELPVALATVCLLVAAAPGGARLSCALAARPLAFVGVFSYSIYLLHAPLLQAEWQYGLRPWHPGRGLTLLLLDAVGVPLVLLAAYIFHRAFERPFTGGRRGATARGRQPAAAPARAA